MVSLKKSCKVENPIVRTYDKIKQDFIVEPYLYLVKKPKCRITISKLRCSPYSLAVEKDRHAKADLPERLCLFRKGNKEEDEIHFIIECCFYKDERDRLFRKVIIVNLNYASMHGVDNFVLVFRTNNERSLAWLGKLVHESPSKRVDLDAIWAYEWHDYCDMFYVYQHVFYQRYLKCHFHRIWYVFTYDVFKPCFN